MKSIKVSELTGAGLDWAVQQCEGARKDIDFVWWTDGHYSPSTDWSHGGPIIEREEISVNWASGQWQAHTTNDQDEYVQIEYGPTPLVATMRCYVASKMGDTIEVLEELL